MVFDVGTQLEDLPHAALHFDPVPSLSCDSDVGDLPKPFQSLPSGFVCRACALPCNPFGEDCVVLAGYILSACAVPLQRLAPVLPGLTETRHGDAGSILKAIESFGAGVGQWLKVVADSKAQLVETCMRLRPTRLAWSLGRSLATLQCRWGRG